MIVRNYIKGEPLPEQLRTGFENGSMPEWIWVCERDGKIVCLLVAAPAHIVVILLRVLSTLDAKITDMRSLLVHALSDIKERGFSAYITWLNPEKPNENALLNIIKNANGIEMEEEQVLCGGKI